MKFCQTLLIFLYYFLEKVGLVFFFFFTNQLLFFFCQLEVTFRFSCSLETPTVLTVFSEVFADADNYRCQLHSLMPSPTTLCLVNELFKNHVMGVFKSSLELGKKSGSAGRRRGGNDNAWPLYCQVILRYKWEDVNSCPQDTWSQRSWEKEGQAGRGLKRWSELFSQSIIEKQKRML